MEMAREQNALRAVVLHHQGVAEPHFDLMFETSAGSLLATWRSPTWPISEPTVVEKLDDHRAAYLDYEGPLSQNRGYVTRIKAIDHGDYIEYSQKLFFFRSASEEFRFVKRDDQWLLTFGFCSER